jgi:uncharacterized protein YgbK (DUF1537 family)
LSLLLGAIADDFTGATDLANTLVKAGMPAVQLIGVPDEAIDLGDASAVVVALKSRTIAAEDAVAQSLAASRWLEAQGTRQFFFKYCSTFDSTEKGNIGPVADALLDALGSDFAFVCPAFPTTGRTIYQGTLFVGDKLLSESSMRDHPLTPMRDASLVRLMAAQSRHPVGLVPYATVANGAGAIAEAVERLRKDGIRYGVIDAITDGDLHAIGAAAAAHRLVTGGSGVALGLPENFRRMGLLGPASVPKAPARRGRPAVLAGSCSEATRRQIAAFANRFPARKLDVDRLLAGEPVVEEAVGWVAEHPGETPVLVYSSAEPAEVAALQQKHGREPAGAAIETAFGAIARALVEVGCGRLIVAGGETSGAVVTALGIRALRIGPEIDPGVPWTEALADPPLALALKSGNFGADDFFLKAFDRLR